MNKLLAIRDKSLFVVRAYTLNIVFKIQYPSVKAILIRILILYLRSQVFSQAGNYSFTVSKQMRRKKKVFFGHSQCFLRILVFVC